MAFTVYPFGASIPTQIAPHSPRLDDFMTPTKTKILCIEDDRETAALIAEELIDRGYEVVLGHDGREGLAAILRTMPDLVLSDISMPAMSGFELLDALAALSPRFSRMPFIFLTALTDRDNELKGRRGIRWRGFRTPLRFAGFCRSRTRRDTRQANGGRLEKRL